MMYALMVVAFSLVVLALAIMANLELSSAASPSPLRLIYATVLTLVGVLGVMIGIALVTLHKRVAQLEDKDKHPEELR